MKQVIASDASSTKGEFFSDASPTLEVVSVVPTCEHWQRTRTIKERRTTQQQHPTKIAVYE
jgi:hypothetical protein